MFTQPPLQQVWPAPQRKPHTPQLSVVVRLTHAPEQHALAPVHADDAPHMQVPAVQVSPTSHTGEHMVGTHAPTEHV